MERLTIDGRPCRLYRQGRGQPLVYLHSGYGETGRIPLFKALAERGFAVFAPELPGFGSSDAAPEWNRIEDAVFHLGRVLQALDLERPTVMGASLGGWLAAELAVWFPDRIGDLVLVDAVGISVPDAALFDIFLSSPEAAVAAALPHGGDVTEMVRPALDTPDEPTAVILHFLKAMEVLARLGWNPYLHDPKLLRRLGFVEARTLLLWGADDGVAPPAYGSAYAAAIPGAQLEFIPGCGHVPALEQPEVVAEHVAGFCLVKEAC